MKPMTNVERMERELDHAGRNAFSYIDTEYHAERPVTLHTYRPHAYTEDRPVVIVQHGVLRNGDEYRDFWVPAAERYNLLIVAPTFSNEAWPEVDSYNNGRAITDSGTIRPPAEWTYALLEKIFADLQRSGVTAVEQAHLFGHSAGGQFVHRLMSSQSHEPFRAVAVGNPGWYTLPSFDYPFPEGMGDAGIAEEQLVRLLGFPLLILAGDQDILTDDPNLPSEPAAMRQGPHRFARARFYFEAGCREAERRNVPFNWVLQTVPGIGHDGRAMSAACASLWFEGRMPDAAELAALASPHVA